MTDDRSGAKGGRWRRAMRPLALVLATAIVTVAATEYADQYIYAQRMARLHVAEEIRDAPNFAKLLDVLDLIEKNYYQNPKEPGANGRTTAPPVDKLLEGAVAGAVAALDDPYSMYFDASALKQFQTDTSGEYSGIGVQVQQKDGYVIVLRAFPGTPAATTPYVGAPADAPKGLLPNDRIVAVDGKDVVNQDIDQVANIIKGPEGTHVKLTVLRPGEGDAPDQTLVFDLVRARIQVPLVDAHMIDGTDVGYISLVEFDGVAGEEFGRGLDELRAEGARAIVLDLRGNPGGLLDAASDVASYLLPPGVLAYVVHRGGKTETWSTHGHGQGLGMPLVVLVNPYTASAAEILAGAIQDYGAGVVVGENTFGKAVVQQTYTYDDDTGVKLTVAQWLTPKKRTINKVGLTPDVLMKEPANAEIGTLEKDPQLQRALQIAQEKIGETPSVFAPLPSEGAPAQGTSQ